MDDNKPLSIDIGNFDSRTAAEEGSVLTVTHPVNGKDTDMKITLLGMDSDTAKSFQHENSNKRFKKGQKMTSEEVDEAALKLLALLTRGWENVTLKGEPLPCNPHNARLIYGAYPWLKEQVDTFVNDRSNYLGNSGTAS